MRVFVAGATGAIGRQLVPQLIDAGHGVTAMVRSPAARDAIQAMGATPVQADALVAREVATAVAAAEPEVIVHELTAIPAAIDMRSFDRTFAATNRLRTLGTDHLLSAGRAIGVDRFIAQSFAGWPLAREGAMVKDENATLDPRPVATMRETFDALVHLERSVTSADWTHGLVLRYGFLYGPGTSLGRDGEQTAMIAKRRFPVVGSGAGVWSFVHVADAAAATVAAVQRGDRGIYHVVDDDPAPVADWLPAAAAALGAKRPPSVPRWLGRLLAGEAAAMMMTEVRGASNAKARRELGWTPVHPSWRAGFLTELA